jgi:hypothetical protein
MTLSPSAERRLLTFLPPLLVALLAVPFVLHQNAWWEWTVPLWFLERQADHVAAHGVPTFFLHTQAGAFSDFFVFYCGFTLSLLAYPAVVFGAWPVFAAVSAGTLVAGYLGIWWTARNLGLSRRLAPLPALAFAANPYVLTDLYGRGAWSELVAVNAAAVILGGVTAFLLCPQTAGARAFVALALATALVSGTHNLTLLLSAMALPLVVAALLPLAPVGAGLSSRPRRLATAGLAVLLGLGLTGAWLVPNLWLGPHTRIADGTFITDALLSYPDLYHYSTLLSPWPSLPPSLRGTGLYPQPSVLALAWALVGWLGIAWTRRRAPDRTIAAGAALLALGAALLVLVAHPPWWQTFPLLLQAIQYPYRVISYLAIVVAILVAIVLAALPRGTARRGLIAALVVASVAQLAMSASIAIGGKRDGRPGMPFIGRTAVVADREPPAFSWGDTITDRQFFDARGPAGPTPFQLARLRMASRTMSDTAAIDGRGRPGDSFGVTMAWSPLVRVTGDARLTGRTALGLAVLPVTKTDGAGRWTATARPACTVLCLNALTGGAAWQLMAGRLLTLVSALALVVLALRLRRRSRAAEAVAHVAASGEHPADTAPRRAAAPAS